MKWFCGWNVRTAAAHSTELFHVDVASITGICASAGNNFLITWNKKTFSPIPMKMKFVAFYALDLRRWWRMSKGLNRIDLFGSHSLQQTVNFPRMARRHKFILFGKPNRFRNIANSWLAFTWNISSITFLSQFSTSELHFWCVHTLQKSSTRNHSLFSQRPVSQNNGLFKMKCDAGIATPLRTLPTVCIWPASKWENMDSQYEFERARVRLWEKQGVIEIWSIATTKELSIENGFYVLSSLSWTSFVWASFNFQMVVIHQQNRSNSNELIIQTLTHGNKIRILPPMNLMR